MEIKTAARKRWDVVVIGTGMGGATIGWALAQAGKSVLFLERGQNLLAHENFAGEYAEMITRRQSIPLAEILPKAGRWNQPLDDYSTHRKKTFTPFIGMGSGGSSSLYGGALERFFPEDFEPGKHHPHDGNTTLPPAWPVTYEEMRPWYRAAEKLFQVYGATDPLRASVLDPLAPSPPYDPVNRGIAEHLQTKGLHPYRVPGACAEQEKCRDCQGYLCATGGKRDSATVCLAPALTHHGAALVDNCEVIRAEAGQQAIHSVVCRSPSGETRIQGEVFIFAAGALQTPLLLLRSANRHWPRGLANGSGMVGRNLMRHAIDLYLVKLPQPLDYYRKQIAFNDFYLTGNGKLGSVQSFGMLPPLPMIMDSLRQDFANAAPWLAPLFPALRPVLARAVHAMISGKAAFAGILEDLPYLENRVETDSEGKGKLYYRLSDYDKKRLKTFRREIQTALAPWPVKRLDQAGNNERIAHVCGTCRFGNDPDTSVLNRWNQAHELDNLYIADASFFPSSGGINPALTIAANALRIADHLTHQ